METNEENEKFACCLGCLCTNNDSALFNYKINNGTLKSIIQLNEICLCYICKHLAQKMELFIQNIQSNQILLQNIHNDISNSILQTAKAQSQLLCLISTTLLPVELGIDRNKDVSVKLEVKDEEEFLNQLEGEFIDNDNDFQDSEVKEEDDDFPLKDLLKEECNANGLGNDLSHSVRRKAGKKIERRKKHAKIKKGLQVEISKEEYTLNNLLKEELGTEDLARIGFGDSEILEAKEHSEKDLFKTKVVYITREQCLEERAKLAEDKKYLNSTHKCSDCIKGFYFKESYEKHMKSHSKAMGDYECDICKQRTDSKSKLLRHRKCHEVRYMCMECGLTRINRLTIREHYNAFHLKLESYKCAHCPKAFKRQVSLRKHVSYAHRATARVKCPHCLKSYANKEVLKSHIIARHGEAVRAAPAARRHVCRECGAAFAAPSQLRNHSVKHSAARDYYCVECDKSFKSETGFKRHVKSAAPHVNYLDLPLACTRCEKRFSIRRDLERHTNRVHLNIRPFQCDKCDKAYINNWSLNEHKRFVHDGHKRPLRYPCSMCDKVFDRNQTLKAHVRTHTGERPYPCARCGARFAQSSARGTHVRLVHMRVRRRRERNDT